MLCSTLYQVASCTQNKETSLLPTHIIAQLLTEFLQVRYERAAEPCAKLPEGQEHEQHLSLGMSAAGMPAGPAVYCEGALHAGVTLPYRMM